MMRKRAKSASPEWFAGAEHTGSDPNAAFGFRVPEQNGSVHVDPWSSGECRFQWQTRNPYPGSAHPHWRFDGAEWKVLGWPRLHKKVWEEGQPAIYEDRLSMMVDDGSVPMFAQQGCWLTCHDGMRDSPGLAATDDVKAHPLLGGVLKKKDVRKYLPASRSDDDASWDKTLSVEEIAALKAAGGFVDLMQWRGHRSNAVGMADDGYVLEYRLSDAGKGVFSKNWDNDV